MSDTKREQLADAAWSALEDKPWADALAIEKHPYMLQVDAILRAMQEPSERMLAAGDDPPQVDHDDVTLMTWKAMIQHVIDGGE